MAYPYKPLNHREIRVLKTINVKQLTFSTRTISLDDKTQEYSTVSYCWHEPLSDYSVSLDGYRISVSTGLYDCLCGFQNKLELGKATPFNDLLWIDALSINQADTKSERPTQVAMMKDIYEGAKQVYIWLGNPPDHEANLLAIKKMSEMRKALFEEMRKNLEYRPPLWPRKRHKIEDASIKFAVKFADREAMELKRLGSLSKAWVGIRNILASPWWERTWVYQEATVPSVGGIKVFHWKTFVNDGQVKLYSGNCCFGLWPDVTTMELVLIRLITVPGPVFDSTIFRNQMRHLRRLTATSTARADRESGMPVLRALQALRLTRCRDARDKVYATKGLIIDAEKILGEPNYEMPAAEVYTALAVRMLACPSIGLSVLGFAMRSVSVPAADRQNEVVTGLSSWVPNWSDSKIFFPLFKELVNPDPRLNSERTVAIVDKRNISPLPAIKKAAYHADAGLPSMPYSIGGRHLLIHGVAVDAVLDFYSYAGPADTVRAKIRHWKTRGEYPTGESFVEVVNHLQCADIKSDVHQNPAARGGTYIRVQIEDSRDLDPIERNRREGQRDICRAATTSRAACQTKKGYLGLIPDASSVGDQICAFSGGSVLYVLRRGPEPGCYQYIGESYVHGLMDGAAAEMVQAGEAVLEEFCLL